jgi:hypothetical protein
MKLSYFVKNRLPLFCLPLLTMVCGMAEMGTATPPQPGPTTSQTLAAGPTIHGITTNLEAYAGGQIPAYEKLEITFSVDTEAQNLQMPYDPAPPPGVVPEIGISVDALFSPDNWVTVYTQPAFYYQAFLDEIRGGREWFYPTGAFSWKVRFSPPEPGDWQFKLVAQDAGGVSESTPVSFQVAPSNHKGFIRVSSDDPRYFEFENGDYFPGLGYNMNFDHVSWASPVLENQANFEVMSENGIQLVRIWLSQWAIYGPSWNPWNAIDPSQHGLYIPYSGLTTAESYPGSELSMEVDASYNPCMFLGFLKPPPAVKAHTDYRVRIRYRTSGITGPRIAGEPHGLVAKTGGWLWGSGNDCDDPGTGTAVTSHQPQNTPDWGILEGTLNTGSSDFLPYFYLVMENATGGRAYIDHVWIEEDFHDGGYGQNIVNKPWMDHHLYMEQRNSYAFDKLLVLAEEMGVYLRPVIHEKNQWIFNRIDFNGEYTSSVDNNHFYGDGRNVTKVRWLQQAWWRYLQARWGYSTNIHSWELLNEGDPWNGLHYTLADEFGRFMSQFEPNDHLVSTSFWHSFPRDAFWANPEYAAVDFADIHQYIPESDPQFFDAALETADLSLQYGAREPGGANKPLIRGETGFVVENSGQPTAQFQDDTQGVWLHNFIWGGVNAGGMLESYWYEREHIYRQFPNGTFAFDHRPHFGVYHQFIRGVPLNNGRYQALEAQVSEDQIRVLGQRDPVGGRAHLWVQNRAHTWKNVVDGVPIPPLSGTIRITGFQPAEQYAIQWWDPYPVSGGSQVQRVDIAYPQADGSLTLTVASLTEDLAVKIFPGKPSYLPIFRK